jgi:hypothetical protein
VCSWPSVADSTAVSLPRGGWTVNEIPTTAAMLPAAAGEAPASAAASVAIETWGLGPHTTPCARALGSVNYSLPAGLQSPGIVHAISRATGHQMRVPRSRTHPLLRCSRAPGQLAARRSLPRRPGRCTSRHRRALRHRRAAGAGKGTGSRRVVGAAPALAWRSPLLREDWQRLTSSPIDAGDRVEGGGGGGRHRDRRSW